MDEGHKKLVEDLKALLLEAEDCEFHDFQNTKYATPKVALYEKLGEMQKNVIEGKYDN